MKMATQQKLFNDPIPEKKLKKKFNRYIKRYRAWCKRYGYNSKDTNTLLWFFNQDFLKMAYRDNGNYFILYQAKAYRVDDLITIFARGQT